MRISDCSSDVCSSDLEAKPALQAPPMYKVVLFNDDYTPMDFVVEVLEVFFNLNRELATKVMLAVHTEGRAVCGVFTRDIAETKAMTVKQYARESQPPQLCENEQRTEERRVGTEWGSKGR